jgi:signal transduction histidine kinase/phage shock protein PspC (stress-responsive transcriptional regulator)
MSHPPAPPGPASPSWDYRRATRDARAPIIGGVASGLARHLGLPVMWVRVAFVVLAAAGGFGIAMYGALWVFLPSDSAFDEAAPGIESATRGGRRPGQGRRLTDVGPAIAVAALAFGVILGFEAVFGQGALFWPIVVGVAGVALLWRQADEAQRERWLDSTGRIDPFRAVFGSGGWQSYGRIGAGLLLIIAALVLFAVFNGGSVRFATDVVVAGLLGIAGLALVVVPWVVRLVADLSAERAERVRTQERADLAAHLHDSVLQTLALIQRSSHDAATVARLARAQERDLRSWLFEAERLDETTMAGELRRLAAEVEDLHAVPVDLVTVGDVDLTEQLRPVTLAAREAMANAARHSGAGRVDVYLEVTPEDVDVFVRDRGAGFDPAGVAPDRQGLRGSIVDRMDRHGGRADVRSAPGEGTEVRLHMPRGGDEQ